jgi:hypothetical protein
MTANNESIVALNAEFKQLEVDAAKVEQKKQKAQVGFTVNRYRSVSQCV